MCVYVHVCLSAAQGASYRKIGDAQACTPRQAPRPVTDIASMSPVPRKSQMIIRSMCDAGPQEVSSTYLILGVSIDGEDVGKSWENCKSAYCAILAPRPLPLTAVNIAVDQKVLSVSDVAAGWRTSTHPGGHGGGHG